MPRLLPLLVILALAVTAMGQDQEGGQGAPTTPETRFENLEPNNEGGYTGSEGGSPVPTNNSTTTTTTQSYPPSGGTEVDDLPPLDYMTREEIQEMWEDQREWIGKLRNCPDSEQQRQALKRAEARYLAISAKLATWIKEGRILNDAKQSQEIQRHNKELKNLGEAVRLDLKPRVNTLWIERQAIFAPGGQWDKFKADWHKVANLSTINFWWTLALSVLLIWLAFKVAGITRVVSAIRRSR